VKHSIGLKPWVLLVVAGFPALSAAEVAPTAPTAASVSGGDNWPSFNNRLDGQRFSPLAQITPANVASLKEVCRVQIDGPTAFSAGLVVVDGVIYTNTGRQTVAIDAESCEVRWRHTYVPDEEELRQSSRGLAYLDGKVFRGTGDGRLLAIDARTGELVWKNVIGSPRLSEFASAAPLAWQGVVYMAIGGGDAGIRGRVMAYDAASGRELWRFNTIPMGKETGADSWKRPQSARTGGGGVWGAMSLDVTTGELFVPVGNPWPDIDIGWRPGKNLFTNSMVVLDAHTGRLKWWHQAVSGDAHDLDLAAAPVLYRDSRIRDIMAFGGKDGYVVGVDRDTRALVFRTPVARIENPGARATRDGVHICPGFAGGIEWNGPTLDRTTNFLVTPVVEWCMTIVSAPTIYAPPRVAYGGFPKPDPEAKGAVTAIDAQSGVVKWRVEVDRPVVAGVTPTAGGVIFTGDMGGNFLALDGRTGAILKRYPTGGALAGGVVTYERRGIQYVAMASGNVSRATFGVLGLPSVILMSLDGRTMARRSPAGAEGSEVAPRSKTSADTLYSQICASCHGSDGDQITDHKLSTLAARRDQNATIAYIKDPRLPMPKMYPDLLTDENVADLAVFLHAHSLR
jgi:alcohol dehydrogenase (cytochrome c)